MDVLEERRGGVLVLKPQGRIDSVTAKAFEDRACSRVDGGDTTVVIDFSAVDYISSAGMRVLLVVGKRTKAASGRLVLCGIPAPLLEVFEITGFTSIFPVYPTVAESLLGLG